MDTCDAKTRILQHQIDRQSFRKEQSRNGEDKRSVYSKASARLRASRPSRVSSIDLKKADAAAELAAKQAKFDALQEEAKYKEETAKMEALEAQLREETAKMEAQLRAETARIENELKRRKLELEQIKVKKQIEIARAKLMVYEEVEQPEDDVDSIEDHIIHIPPALQANRETTPTSFPQPIPIKDSMTVVNAPRPLPQSNQHSQQVNQSYFFDESNQLPHGQVV